MSVTVDGYIVPQYDHQYKNFVDFKLSLDNGEDYVIMEFWDDPNSRTIRLALDKKQLSKAIKFLED